MWTSRRLADHVQLLEQDEADDVHRSESAGAPDEHEEYVRSVRAFRVTLLRSSLDLGNEGSDSSSGRPSVSSNWKPGQEGYIARFAQPCPVRPIWDALPPETGSQETGGAQTTECTGAPLVCVVMKDSHGSHAPVREALCRLACHPDGLVVNVKAIFQDDWGKVSDKQPQLLFAMIGLNPFTPGAVSAGPSAFDRGRAGEGDASRRREFMSKADEREVVWAAVHEALQDEDGALPDLVVDVYMLQDVYLYERLFRWLTVRAVHKRSCAGPLRSLSKVEMDLLAHEFGEEIATHFLFVAQYIKHLRVAACVSALCTVALLLDACDLLPHRSSWESAQRIMLVVFLPAWGFHFTSSWRATASRAGFRWLGSLGSVQDSIKELAVAQALESPWERCARYMRVLLMSVPLMVGQLLIVFATTAMFVCSEVYLNDVMTSAPRTRFVAFCLYNIAYAVAFVFFLGAFHPVSKAVTRWERHPNADIEEWHMIAKMYANWFLLVFLYFFMIAFVYVPFGSGIADFLADTFTAADGPGTGTVGTDPHTIRGALLAFKPDLTRLNFDVSLFFLAQDSARLCQVLIPVLRAAWGLGRLKGVQRGRLHREKRKAIFCGAVWAMCPTRCPWRRSSSEHISKVSPGGSDASPADGSPARRSTPPATSAMKLLQPQVPKTTTTKAATAGAPGARGVYVVYVVLDEVEVVRQAARGEGAAKQAALAVLLACRLELLRPAGNGASTPRSSDARGQDAAADQAAMTSRLRVCQPERDEQRFSEDPVDGVSDLFTLVCDPENIATHVGELSDGLPKLCISAEVLDASGEKQSSTLPRSDSSSSKASNGQTESWITISLGNVVRGRAEVHSASEDKVCVSYLVGVVQAPTHHQALEQVPQAVKNARMSAEGVDQTPRCFPAAQDRHESSLNDVMPSFWWDQELTETTWGEAVELYATKESFGTFEIYGHLATQFSYVCLFGTAVPACPMLAWIFTAIEARQDQLRLLWLSRPPHPHQETMRFKRSVSLGAWSMIFKFTCHMSVVVNLLLLGLTYGGFGDSDPCTWSGPTWWRAIAVFLLFHHAFEFAGSLLRCGISSVDHETAAAYLRRNSRLQRALAEQGDSRQGGSWMTRPGSKGLSVV